MSNEDLKRQIEAAILAGRRRWGLRELEEVYAKYQKASREERVQIQRNQALHFGLITKYTAVVGFHEYVERECAKTALYGNLRRLITDTILRSILHTEGADLREYDKAPGAGAVGVDEPSQENGRQYTRRRVQDIVRRVVPGEFIIVGDDSLSGEIDRRLRPVKSVHAPVPLPPSDQRSIAQLAIDAEAAAMETDPQWQRVKLAGEILRYLSPTYLGNLLQFREIVRHSLDRSRSPKGEERERQKVLRELLLHGLSRSLYALHHDVGSQVALRWWEKRTVANRKKLLAQRFPFKVDMNRIKQSLALHRRLGIDTETTARVLHDAALALDAVGLTDGAVLVWKYLSDVAESPPLEAAIAAENAAVLLGRQGRWDLAQPLLDRAIRAYDEAPDSYRKAVALKNRGEFKLLAGLQDGNQDLAEAERIGGSLVPTSRFAVHWNLAMAALRRRDSPTSRRHLKRCLEDRDHVEPEWVNTVCDLLLGYVP